jgi:ActR/RegA family two-component response regulator
MEKISLLLVDDEEEFREATVKALNRRGFKISQAKNGQVALEMIASISFDVVVLDLRMPEKDGIDTLVELRLVNKELPVVILTGHGALDSAIEGIQLGIVDFIQKPVDMDFLAARIKEFLFGDARASLGEKKISEIMIDVSRFKRVYSGQPIGDVIRAMIESITETAVGNNAEQGQRAVLVYDQKEEFIGCVQISQFLDSIIPENLKGSLYAPHAIGGFVAQCKLIGKFRAEDLIAEKVFIETNASLLEAVHTMVEHSLNYLPVLQGKTLVGVLSELDLLFEIARANYVGNN